MDRKGYTSGYHFLSKLGNKLLHRPTNDVVNFRGRGCVECACIRWERSRKRMNRGSFSISTFVKIIELNSKCFFLPARPAFLIFELNSESDPTPLLSDQ